MIGLGKALTAYANLDAIKASAKAFELAKLGVLSAVHIVTCGQSELPAHA